MVATVIRKPNSKQDSYRSAEALRHPKPSLVGRGPGVPLIKERDEWGTRQCSAAPPAQKYLRG